MSFYFLIFLYFSFNAETFAKSVRIIGGNPAEIVDYPHAAVIKKISTNEHVCSGSIITNKHILSTAHCVDPILIHEDDIKIVVGVTDLLSPSANELHAENIFINPIYREPLNPNEPVLGDLSVIKVREFIEFNRYQNKINLPRRNVRYNYIGTLSGWGITNYVTGSRSNTLKAIWLRILTNEHCNTLDPTPHFHDQFCAFQRDGTGPCIGDNGSALAYNNVIVGVAAMSIPCGAGVPDMFTNVFYHIDFINRALQM